MPTAQMVPTLDRENKPQLEVPEWTERENETREWTKQKESPAIWCEPPVRDLSVERIRKQLSAEIARTQLLEMEDNWDGDGSPRYSKDTVDRAIEFVVAQAIALRDFGLCVPMPRIGPGPDGSVDLHWKQSSWELLVNIPADAGEVATFYGDDYRSQKIRGSVNAGSLNRGIAEWLLK